jgi:hypothetical protein
MFARRNSLVSVCLVFTASLWLVAVPGLAQQEADTLAHSAEDEPWTRRSRYTLWGGVFIPVHSTAARLTSVRTEAGTEVGFESDLGLAERTVTFRIDGAVRLGRRHKIVASYYRLKREATQRLGRDLVWGPDTLFVGRTVESVWDLTTLNITYEFSLLQKRTWEVGLIAGAYLAAVKGGVQARESGRGSIEEYTFPLPLLGADLRFYPMPRLALSGIFEYFALSIDEFKGRITQVRALVGYNLWRHLAIGVAYNLFDITLEDKEWLSLGDARPEVRWGVRYKYSGPGLMVSLTF